MGIEVEAQNGEGYTIMKTAELNHILQKESGFIDTFYQLESNKAYVTIFKDNSGIILPTTGGGEGIFFDNIKFVKLMIETGVYPIKSKGSYWEREKERIITINDSLPFYLSVLSKHLNFDIRFDNDSVYLKELSEVVNNVFKRKKKNKGIYYYFAIYIGEILRRQINAEWKLLPIYTLNVYYTPELVKDNQFCDVIYNVVYELERIQYWPTTIEDIIYNSNKFYPYNERDFIDISK